MTEHAFLATMIVYAANSETGTYLMYNPGSKTFILTRDIKWHVFNEANSEN